MRTLDLPQRFPLPQNMKNSPVETWVQWIRDESNKLIAAIDEEITRCQDPDDPFDGTASGIFPPLQNIATSQQGVTQGAKSIKPDESRNHSPQAVGTTQENWWTYRLHFSDKSPIPTRSTATNTLTRRTSTSTKSSTNWRLVAGPS